MPEEPDSTSRKPPGWKRRCLIAVTVLIALAVVLLAIFFPRVEDARGEPRTCELHGVELLEDIVPVRWGGDRPLPERYAREMLKNFPNANPVHPGSCEPRQARRARVRYCPKCREALAAWLGRTTLNEEERSLLRGCTGVQE